MISLTSRDRKGTKLTSSSGKLVNQQENESASADILKDRLDSLEEMESPDQKDRKELLDFQQDFHVNHQSITRSCALTHVHEELKGFQESR